ncbi:MAG: hypothetical protein ACK4OO_04065 [bacterium]
MKNSLFSTSLILLRISRSHNAVRVFFLIFGTALAFIIGGVWGCKGKTGPAGADAFLSDTLPPWVEWISPLAGGEVDSLLFLIVKAGDDQGIREVIFSIGGWEVTPDSSRPSTPPPLIEFFYTWKCSSFPEGDYPIVAIVWDLSYHFSRTPTLWVRVKHSGSP